MSTDRFATWAPPPIDSSEKLAKRSGCVRALVDALRREWIRGSEVPGISGYAMYCRGCMETWDARFTERHNAECVLAEFPAVEWPGCCRCATVKACRERSVCQLLAATADSA